MTVISKSMQKILIVDDDPKILEVIADIIREGSYTVDTASNGTKAKVY